MALSSEQLRKYLSSVDENTELYKKLTQQIKEKEIEEEQEKIKNEQDENGGDEPKPPTSESNPEPTQPKPPKPPKPDNNSESEESNQDEDSFDSDEIKSEKLNKNTFDEFQKKGKSILTADDNIHLDNFKNYQDYLDWIDNRLKNLENKYNQENFDNLFNEHTGSFNDAERIKKDANWFGTDSLAVLQSDIREFINPTLMKELHEKFRDKMVNLDIYNRIPKKKLTFNDIGRGIFSFDLASNGLIPVYEFIDKTGEVVEDDLIDSRKSDSINSYNGFEYYNRKTVEILTRRNKLRDNPDGHQLRTDIIAAKVLLNEKTNSAGTPQSEVQYLIDDIFEMENRLKKYHKYKTTTEKVFVDIENKFTDIRSVEFVIETGGNGDAESEQLIYKAMPSILLAEKLEECGYQVKISIANGSYYGNTACYAIIPVKDYGEQVDVNLICLLTSDPRVYRYKVFKELIAIPDKYDVPSYGLGRNSDSSEEIFLRNELIKNEIKTQLEFNTDAFEDKSNYNKFFFGQEVRTEKKVMEIFESALEYLMSIYSEKPIAMNEAA